LLQIEQSHLCAAAAGAGFAHSHPALVRYVYIDIVDFTVGRSIEAQTEIIAALGMLVNQVIASRLPASSTSANVLFLPTGDGLCVGLINLIDPYDLDIQIALTVLEQLHARNGQTRDTSRRFAVRIGINENQDNLITDIRGGLNVVGLGINLAQRVMSVAEPSRLLLGPAVHERLRQRELYRPWLRPVQAIVKHGQRLRCHEYFNPNLACFRANGSRNNTEPAALVELPKAAPPGSKRRRSSANRQPPSFQISP
jgi:class 3 adenylate cyclase